MEPARHLPTGTVTFLFSDIEGSTRLLQRLGDGYGAVLEEHAALLRQAFIHAGGYPVSTEGDSFFVVFESAPAAVLGAAGAQRALEEHPWPHTVRVRVRMGLHTGEGKLGGENYIGIDVHRAARIMSAAHGGQVLLSGATRALVEGALPAGVSLRDLGRHRLKDLEQPERLAQVLIDGLQAEFPPVRTLDARPNNLPTQLTSFVGRTREIEAVKEALAASRLVTLTGPGGTGKTRLSIQTGMDLLSTFEHGVFFVQLAPIDDPSLVPSTIAHTIGVAEEGARPIMDTLREHLAELELLLILDNFEQVTEAGAPISELLAAAPRVRVLVTSREVLHLSGEMEYGVPPLELPDIDRLPPMDVVSQYESVKLFGQRARAVHPGFMLTDENAAAIAEICARLDGLPLAIELAAARVRVLSPQAILARLQNRLGLLTGGARDLPRRQQTLRDAIGWSFDLLDEAERVLFRRLSVFVGGSSLEAAEAVCDPGGEIGVDVLDGMASLVDKSLLRRLDTEAGEPRFRMLHVIREYGLERLDESEERDEIRRRHADFFRRLAEEAAPLLTGRTQGKWLDVLQLEHDNLRGALEWLPHHDRPAALRLGAGMWRFWQIRGYLQEGRKRLTELVAGGEEAGDPVALSLALEALGGVKYWMGDFEEARGEYERTLEMAGARADRASEANALYNISFTYSVPGDQARADPFVREALQIYREIGDPAGIAKCAWADAFSAYNSGDFERARALAEEAAGRFRELGDVFGLSWALHTLAISDIRLADLRAARDHIGEALAFFQEAGDLSGFVLLLGDIAYVAYTREDLETAMRIVSAALALERATGLYLFSAGWVYLGLPRPEEWPSTEAIRAARAEGEAMSPEDAIAYGLKWLDEAVAAAER